MTAVRRGHRASSTVPSAHVVTVHTDPFQLLTAEHAMLRRDFARLLQAASDGHPADALRLANEIADSLDRHLRDEETVVYPVCERLFGGKTGAASVLREDHASIRDRMGTLLARGRKDGAPSPVRVDMLRLEMDVHFGREERVLFPMVSALLSGTESDALARRLRAARP